jgi:NAD+ synthase
MKFHKDVLKINCESEVEQICTFIKQQVIRMKCDGAVIGLSGGIDSTLCAELCVKALDKEHVLGLVLPEKESSPVSVQYVAKQVQKMGLHTITVDITPALEGIGTYEKRDEAIKMIFPEYNSRYKSKIVLPSDLLSRDAFNFFTLKIEDEHGKIRSSRLDSRSMRRIVAATNTKQRTRMLHLYYYAELNNYLVCGTTNRNEAVQGFFVKYGDGGVDIEPIQHLYKTQVYRLAEYLGVIDEIIRRPPTPDTFSLEVTDEEMYFRIPFDTLDLLLYAWEHQIPINDVCEVMSLKQEQVQRAFRDFTSKYNATNYVRAVPAYMER